ncbi:MAG TPA: hypothetical protein VKW06_00400 [Candidatus Angelobacter sp.]|nr:hypothetical protein [Candidatus Angelobacter sp.]
MDQQQAKFEGWAVIEMFGHQREAGFVTTQYFGNAAMFQLDVPELEEREQTTSRPGYIDGQFCPAGTKCKKAAVIGRSRLINPSAVYAMNPCSKEAALKAIDEISPREIKVIELPNQPQLATTLPGEDGGDSALDDEFENDPEEEEIEY